MKKALTIILTLILGFGANYLISWGMIAVLLFITDLTPIWFAAAAAVIAALTVLLLFVGKKLAKILNTTVFILCAQLPFVIFFLIGGRGGFSLLSATLGTIPIASIIASAAFANKDKIKKWWSGDF